MGTSTQHQQKADNNERFLTKIQLLGFPDWTATVVFYVSVHLVEKMFAIDNFHGNSHPQRNDRLLKSHPDVYADYHPLYNFSRWARYDSEKPFDTRKIHTCFERLESLRKKVEAYMTSRSVP